MRLTQWNIILILCTLVINQSVAAIPSQCQSNNHFSITAQATLNHADMDHSGMIHEMMVDSTQQTTSDRAMSCCDDCQCDANTCQSSVYDSNNITLYFDGHHNKWVKQPTWLIKKHIENLLKPPTFS